MNMEIVISDGAEDDGGDFIDALTHPSNTFAATSDMKKAEYGENTGYLIPEDPNGIVDRLRYFIDIQKRGLMRRLVHLMLIVELIIVLIAVLIVALIIVLTAVLTDGKIARLIEKLIKKQTCFWHEGAPAQRAVRQHLDRPSGLRYIGQAGLIAWPPQSPDLTPLDYFVERPHEVFFFFVYETPLASEEGLVARVVAAAEQIQHTPSIIERVYMGTCFADTTCERKVLVTTLSSSCSARSARSTAPGILCREARYSNVGWRRVGTSHLGAGDVLDLLGIASRGASAFCIMWHDEPAPREGRLWGRSFESWHWQHSGSAPRLIMEPHHEELA
ncbi:hypothetical protein PR048_015758 [Dryococelus australis]|uniref:Uncharacterized protein n=1 Tax=Dryococelus australis TaxID=614101 RepID=A0ABQ9HHU3_9NEOP|nr:hypothetical protein PR048_015758 [Dryococelus australis]